MIDSANALKHAATATAFPAAEVRFIHDARDIPDGIPLLACDPPPRPHPGTLRALIRRLRPPAPPPPDRGLMDPARLPSLCGILLTDPDTPHNTLGLRAMENAAAAPADAVVLLRADRWERQAAGCIARGFSRFVVPPRRDLETGFRMAIPSREHKLIFLPNYKVMYSSFRDFMRDSFPEFRNAPATTHALNRYIDLQGRAAARVFRFSMVRNPFDRLASAWREKMRREPEHFNTALYARPVATLMGTQEVDFDTFTRFVAAIPDGHADPHWLSCYHNLHARGACLVDYTGRIEQVPEALEEMGRRTGIRWDLPVLNRTEGPGGAYRALYENDATVERVAERYRDDIKAYGYAF